MELKQIWAILVVALACLVFTPGGRAVFRSDDESDPIDWAELGLPIESVKSDWYGIYVNGKRVGYAHHVKEPVLRDGVAYIRKYEKHATSATVLGTVWNVQSEEELLFAAEPPHCVAGGWCVERQGDAERRVELRGEPPAFEAHITEAGTSRVIKTKGGELNWIEATEFNNWFRTPRSVGDTLVHQIYYLGALGYDYHTVTVTAIERTIVNGVSLLYYVADFRAQYSGTAGSVRVGSDGRMLSQSYQGPMEMRLEAEGVASNQDGPADLVFAPIASIDQPLGPPEAVAELIVEVRGDDVELLRDGPRQRTHFDDQRKVMTLSLGARHDPNVPARASDVVLCRQETAAYPIRNAAVRRLAREAIGDATAPREKVRRLVAFVERFIDDAFVAEPLTVLNLIERPKGDCSEHALLFTTLARAAGVPARSVDGLMYMGDEYRHEGLHGFALHAWNEVVLDGLWVPVDPTWGQVEIDATHIRTLGDHMSPAPHILPGSFRMKCITVRKKSP